MLNKKVASEVAIGIILFIAVVLGGIFWLQNSNPVVSNPSSVIGDKKVQALVEGDGVMCTQEAKICADGSYVSRTGAKCEFAACPVSDKSANWQTYKNSKYGFSFKYPVDWKISLSDEDGIFNNSILPPSNFECVRQKESGKLDEFAPCGSVLFGVAPNPEKLKLEDYLKDELGWNYDGAYRDLKKINLKGRTAYSLISSSAYDGNESLMLWVQLADGNFFEIGDSYISENERVVMRDIFDSFVY